MLLHGSHADQGALRLPEGLLSSRASEVVSDIHVYGGKESAMTTTKSRRLPLSVLIVLMMAMCFLHTSGGAANRNSNDLNSFAVLTAPAKQPVRRQILKAATTAFAPSLEMKENVGFLLTPALLVQEILSEDVVVTYPCE